MKLNPKPFPWKCASCRERGVERAIIPYTTELEYCGRLYSLCFSAMEALVCRLCGEFVLVGDSERLITEALRQQAGLLRPEEIRENRESLGLTRKQLAQTLDAHEDTVARWESGGQIVQRDMDKLLRLFFKLPEVRRELGCDETRAGHTPPIAPVVASEPTVNAGG